MVNIHFLLISAILLDLILEQVVDQYSKYQECYVFNTHLRRMRVLLRVFWTVLRALVRRSLCVNLWITLWSPRNISECWSTSSWSIIISNKFGSEDKQRLIALILLTCLWPECGSPGLRCSISWPSGVKFWPLAGWDREARYCSKVETVASDGRYGACANHVALETFFLLLHCTGQSQKYSMSSVSGILVAEESSVVKLQR